MGLGSDGGQGGVWGIQFGSGDPNGVFGPRIDTGDIYGAVFGWGRTTTDPHMVSGGDFYIGIQGGDIYPSASDTSLGAQRRRNQLQQHDAREARRNRRTGQGRMFGARFGGGSR